MGDALRSASVHRHRHKLVGEIHGAITRQHGEDTVLLDNGPRGVEIVPERVAGNAPDGPPVSVEIGPVDGLEAFGEGVEEQPVAVFGPHQACGVVLEVRRQLAALAEREIVAVDGDLLHHDAGLVGFVALAFHAEPGDALAVRRPYGVGVVASVHLDALAFAGEDAVDIDLGVGGECVLLAHRLAAAVGDEAAVRAPGELFGAAERLGGELVRFVAQQVEGVVGGDHRASERCHVGARSLRHPVVPVAVHQVLGGIGFSLVESRIAVDRGLESAVYRADVQDIALVRREFELADAGGDVAYLDLLAELRPLERGLPDLSALQEVDLLAVEGPSGIGHALGVARQLHLVGAVDVAQEEIAAAAVVRYRGIAYAVEHLGSVRGDLRVREPSQGQQDLGTHPAVLDRDIRGPDIPAFIVLSFVASHCAEEDCDGAASCTQVIDSHILLFICICLRLLEAPGPSACAGGGGRASPPPIRAA